MASSRIPERALRDIWQHQRFASTALHTTDGRAVTVLFPGISNPDSGPDFLDARLRIGGVLYFGDVELHCDADAWRRHRHDANPHYNRVVLHVALTDEGSSPPAQTVSRRILPLLVVHPGPDQPLSDSPEQCPLSHPITRCPARDHIRQEALLGILGELGDERLRDNVRRFHRRLLQLADERCGILRDHRPRCDGPPADIPIPAAPSTTLRDRRLWEQLLYEGIMESLGYDKNREPFLSLARSVPLEALRRYGIHDASTMQAVLFGQGGLLPSTRGVHDRESRRYVLGLKRRWRELFPRQRHPLIHPSRWRFFRLRPANFPTARLAAMAFLLPTLFGDHTLRTIIEIFQEEASSQDIRRRLRSVFRFTPDEFWSRHVRFGRTSGRGGSSLGAGRIGDIVVNDLVPIVILYGEVFDDRRVLASARRFFAEHPSLQVNRVTLLVESHLLRKRRRLMTARVQQGAIHLVQTMCDLTRCAECRVQGG